MASIVIEDWMIEEAGLSGTELLVYALVYGCSQKGDGCWHGGYDNMMKRTGASRRSVYSAVDSLLEKGLLTKSTGTIGGKKKTLLMSAEFARAEIAPQEVQKLHSPPHPLLENKIKNIDISLGAYAHVATLFDQTAPSPAPSPASPFILSSLEKDMCKGSPAFVVRLKRDKVAKILSSVAAEVRMPEEEREKYLDWYCEPVSEGSATVRAERLDAFTVAGSAKRWMEKRRQQNGDRKQPLSDYYKDLMQEMDKRFSYGEDTANNPDEQ